MNDFAAEAMPLACPNGATLLILPVDRPAVCPRCARECCVFVNRRPQPLCLLCAAPELAGEPPDRNGKQ